MRGKIERGRGEGVKGSDRNTKLRGGWRDQKDVTTFYFSNFPNNIQEEKLWELFQKWGRLWEIFRVCLVCAKGGVCHWK